ncbi:hypothetical protein [Dethiobacter alkaliphilus]|uniref:hypothetical protein n=1 Tax=Dethiobacter alkaliphilus TaxID=427926 RepID=UPI0022268B06|nr:hypothetical protein [Dethiobacter alkaliphilus]MCW3488627.1 hypothetical protein [Dethiobacter alkaliphilus]
MAEGSEEKLLEMQNLLKQLTLRQAENNKQILRSLQQANAALLEAQQLLQADLKFHEGLSKSGDFQALKDAEWPVSLQELDTQIPPWRLAKPPELQ